MANMPLNPSNSHGSYPGGQRPSTFKTVVTTAGLLAGATGVGLAGNLWLPALIIVFFCLALGLFVLPMVVGIFARNDKQRHDCRYYFRLMLSLFAR